jgi:hypothetical protein
MKGATNEPHRGDGNARRGAPYGLHVNMNRAEFPGRLAELIEDVGVEVVHR